MLQYKSSRGPGKILDRRCYESLTTSNHIFVTDLIFISGANEIILEKRRGVLPKADLGNTPITHDCYITAIKIYKNGQNGENELHLQGEFSAFSSKDCVLLYKELGMEFLGQVHIYDLAKHGSLLQYVFNRKITNLKGVSKFILKNELGITDFRGYNLVESAQVLMNLAPCQLIKIFNNCQNFQDLIKSENAMFCLELCGYSFVGSEKIPDLMNWHQYRDCFSLCCDFNVKFNFKWSENKLREIHDKYSKEKMRVKLEKTDTTPVNYPVSFPVIDNVSLIDSERKCYLEAERQHNCLYSNYWSKIKSRTYVVLGIDVHNVHISVGISKLSWLADKRADQIYRACNAKPIIDELDFVNNNIMKRKDMQAFLDRAFQ